MVTGRSHCDGCGRVLSVPDLVPIASFVFLQGQCRTCESRIDPLQFWAEIAGACIGLGAWFAMPSFLSDMLAAVLGWQLLVLALSDWRAFHLPPAGIGLLACSAAFLPVHAYATGQAPDVVVIRQMAGGALGYLLLAAPALAFRAIRKREGMGSADPPLMGAIGLWAGASGVCFIILLAALLGIGLAMLSAIRARIDDNGSNARQSPDSAVALPLGTMIAIATVVITFAGFSLLTP